MYINTPTSISPHHIGGVMVGVLALSVLDRGVDPRSGQTKGKDYKIGICCFSTKHEAYTCKEKEQRPVVSESR